MTLKTNAHNYDGGNDDYNNIDKISHSECTENLLTTSNSNSTSNNCNKSTSNSIEGTSTREYSNSLNYSNYTATDINAISSVDIPLKGINGDPFEISISSTARGSGTMGIKYLPTWPAINLQFSNLSYDVNTKKGTKRILHKINGQFRSHELTAIMGPSGSGKTTLLNTLAGYGCPPSEGEIMVNNNPRKLKTFRKMSRYIMQHDILDPHFTAMESLMLAAHLKLGNDLTKQQKLEVIDEIMEMLRLKKAANTKAALLSGGEKKRLCIALELVNNPPVIFLDEPTTGLDDLSSSQCVTLLRRIAHAGRTIVCSVHTPSAKIFDMFDKVYVLAEGECIYQGVGSNIVPYMRYIGLSCPLTYNPADFIIEVACREYGNDFHRPMVEAVENGKVFRWSPEYNRLTTDSPTKSETTSGASSCTDIEQFDEEINPQLLKSKSTWWMQYRLLVKRMLIQMWRDKSYMKLKFYMNIVLGLLVGAMYQGIGNDASKALFNFGFLLTIIIAYLYLPLMPVLLHFPTEIKFLKREYFNQWYRLSSYFMAMVTSKLPFMMLLAFIYLSIVYTLSNQPMELFRFCLLFIIAILTAMISDSYGLLITSRFNIVNSMFMGPATAVPMILLSIYGIGYGREITISPLMRVIMSLSYLRHGMEGLIDALYGFNRTDSICPETELFCMFKKSQFLLNILGFENCNYLYSLSFLILFYIVFTLGAFYLIKQRLSVKTKPNALVQYILNFLTKHMNFTSYR